MNEREEPADRPLVTDEPIDEFEKQPVEVQDMIQDKLQIIF